jgi:hypothetical protein
MVKYNYPEEWYPGEWDLKPRLRALADALGSLPGIQTDGDASFWDYSGEPAIPFWIKTKSFRELARVVALTQVARHQGMWGWRVRVCHIKPDTLPGFTLFGPRYEDVEERKGKSDIDPRDPIRLAEIIRDWVRKGCPWPEGL